MTRWGKGGEGDDDEFKRGGGGRGCTRGLDLSYTRSFRISLHSDFYIGAEHYVVLPLVLLYVTM